MSYLHDILLHAERRLVVEWLTPGNADDWESLDVNYEPPRVERLWRQLDDEHRIYLHRIHPISARDTPLLHPHPWPSIVRIVDGVYEMGIAHDGLPASVALRLGAGAIYEMSDPRAWHSVRPILEPSLSVMVTGLPYREQIYDHRPFGRKLDLKPLTDEAKRALFKAFSDNVSKIASWWRV